MNRPTDRVIKKFKTPIYVTKPSLPDFADFIKLASEIWESGHVTNFGPKHQEFESRVADYLNVPFASATTNGHGALELAIRTLKLSGEVITTPFTFASSIHSLVLCGLKPIFCDIEPETYNLSVDKVEDLITKDTCAILAVHVFGNPADVRSLERIAKQHNIKLIFDSAHAFGVEIDGRGIGTYGDINAFSLHATKVFNSIEGGLVTYNNPDYLDIVNALRNFGYPPKSGDEDIRLVGPNMKMSELHASIGLLNLERTDANISSRKAIYDTYLTRLSTIKGLKLITPTATRPNYAYCPTIIDEQEFGLSREQLLSHLADYNIFPRRYFYPLCSNFSCYKTQIPNASFFPVASKISSSIFCLPIYPELSIDETSQICDIIEFAQISKF